MPIFQRSFARHIFIFLFLALSCTCARSAPVQAAALTPDFSISATSLFSETSVNLVKGSTSVPITLTVTGLRGFNLPVSITVSDLPRCTSINPSLSFLLATGGSQKFTITSHSCAPTGDFTVRIQATSGSLSHQTTIVLSINRAPRAYQKGTVLFIESYWSGHRARIGLDTAWGGAIVEASLDGTNFVNAHDTGREVQPALYDGAGHYDDCAGCTGVFGWDPVLGGDQYGHGSPVLEQQILGDSLYVKSQPLQWYPDNKGGGPNQPVLADAYFEQTVSAVSGAPMAFDVHFKLSYFGTDLRYAAQQEVPAVYVNSAYRTLVYYAGTAPWTADGMSRIAVPQSGTSLLYAPEHWAASTDSNGVGVSVFAPSAYPYEYGISFPGGGQGSKGDSTNYQRPLSFATFQPGTVLESDIYIVVGDVPSARAVIYGLHQTVPDLDVFPPLAMLNSPIANALISGANVQVSGWAFGNVAVSKVSVFVDNHYVGDASYGFDRADVSSLLPNAPVDCGWSYALDSTQLINGAHTITVHVTDTSNNETILAPVEVTVKN